MTKKGLAFLIGAVAILCATVWLLFGGLSSLYYLFHPEPFETADVLPLFEVVSEIQAGERTYTLTEHAGFADCFAVDKWKREWNDSSAGAELTLQMGVQAVLYLGDGWVYVKEITDMYPHASRYRVPETVLPAVRAYVEQYGKVLPEQQNRPAA